jgi:hypothetical protein
VSTRAEVIGYSAERTQETLRVLGRLEALEYPFAFTCRQVRILGPIVQSFVAPMLGVRQHPSNGWRIARQLIGDDHARLGAVFGVKHPLQEALGSHLIASLLDQDVQYDAMLINGSSQPVAFAADLQRHLVQMPLIANSPSS